MKPKFGPSGIKRYSNSKRIGALERCKRYFPMPKKHSNIKFMIRRWIDRRGQGAEVHNRERFFYVPVMVPRKKMTRKQKISFEVHVANKKMVRQIGFRYSSVSTVLMDENWIVNLRS